MKLVVSLAASLFLAPRIDPPQFELEGIHRTEDAPLLAAQVYTPIAAATFSFQF